MRYKNASDESSLGRKRAEKRRRRAEALANAQLYSVRRNERGWRVPWSNSERQARYRARKAKAQIEVLIQKQRQAAGERFEAHASALATVTGAAPEATPEPASDIAADLVATLEALAALLPPNE